MNDYMVEETTGRATVRISLENPAADGQIFKTLEVSFEVTQ